MKFLTKHRFSIIDLSIITLAIAMPNLWTLALTLICGAFVSIVIEDVYGTK